MIAHRPDWTISRQRVWGVPIVAFYCEACGTILLEEPIVEHVAARMEAGEGADEWYLRSARGAAAGRDRLREVRRPRVPEGDRHPRRLVRLRVQPCGRPGEARPAPLAGGHVPGGLGPAPRLVPLLPARSRGHPRAPAVPRGAHPRLRGRRRRAQDVEVHREHRGARTTSSRSTGRRSCGSGRPARTTPRTSGSPTRSSASSAEAYRRVRNTCRFLLGNLADFDPARDAVPDAALTGLDGWAMLRLHRTIERVRKAYETYEFHLAFQSLHNFCAVDLSALYLDVLKDRLYTSAANAPERRAAQTACYRILDALVRLMAPILTFTAEEVWDHFRVADKARSVHLTDFPAVDRAWLDESVEQAWETLLRVRGEAAKALELARAAKLIGAALDARVTLYVSDPGLQPARRARGRPAPPGAVHRLAARHRRGRAARRARDGTGPRRAARDRAPGPGDRGAPRGRQEVRPLLDVEPRRRPGPGAPRRSASAACRSSARARPDGARPGPRDGGIRRGPADQEVGARAPGRHPPGRGDSGLLPPRARHEPGRRLRHLCGRPAPSGAGSSACSR